MDDSWNNLVFVSINSAFTTLLLMLKKKKKERLIVI